MFDGWSTERLMSELMGLWMRKLRGWLMGVESWIDKKIQNNTNTNNIKMSLTRHSFKVTIKLKIFVLNNKNCKLPSS